MVLKGVNRVNNYEIRSNGLERSNRVHNAKTRSYGLESSQLGTQWFIVDPIDSFQDLLTSFYYCVPKWLISRPFDLMFVYLYIYYLYIHLHIHAPHAHICTTQKMYVYMHNNKYMCHTHYQKHIWGFMHHIHIHAPPRTYVRIHAPHTHTCTTYTYMHHQIPPENKIFLVDLTSVFYEKPNQNERFLLNNMFFSAFQWNAQHFSVKCTALFTEMHKLTEMRSAFQWNALHFSLKCAVLFTEMHCTFHWNVQIPWKAQHISLKCAALFSNISWAFGFPPSIGLS